MRSTLFNCLVILAVWWLPSLVSAQDSLLEIPDAVLLQQAPKKYLAVFEVQDGQLTGKAIRNQSSGQLGLAGWKRLTALFPLAYRSELVQFNVQEGDRWAGMFDGDGRNDVNRKGYRLSIADYTLRGEQQIEQASRAVTPRRGTLDWTVIHEMGHYICLKYDLIEQFSQAFDGDDAPQPQRNKDPQDYPADGSPKVDGNFVTSYAERNPGDEETVETFTTYLTVSQLPDNPSLVAKKILFFDTVAEVRELRRHIQSLSHQKPTSTAPSQSLNVLLIMADDLRDFGGAFTKEVVKTPNLDRLRARGTTFERAYVQYPVCNPSRSSMMVGLRAEQTGIVGNDIPLRHKMPDIITLPQLCKDTGWQSHAFGKLYHLGGKDAESRQRWMDAGHSWHTAQRYETKPAGRKLLEGRDVTGGALSWCQWGAAEGTDDDQPDGQIAAATVAMIEELGDAPWFIGCGFMKPHDPFIAPKKYFDLYPPETLKPWCDPAGMTAVSSDSVGSGAYGETFAKFTEQEWRELFRAYCAGTSFMDAQLGRVLDALDKGQLWDKTLVIFVGDHGYHTGERKWWNKNTLFERSCRAPLIIAAPGMKGGQTTRSLVEFVDIYPTVADFCGLKMPHPTAGASLRPILADPAASIKDAAFTLVTRSQNRSGQSIRTARWRFTLWSNGATELYDHDADPEELYDVSSQHDGIVTELTARIRKLPAHASNPLEPLP